MQHPVLSWRVRTQTEVQDRASKTFSRSQDRANQAEVGELTEYYPPTRMLLWNFRYLHSVRRYEMPVTRPTGTVMRLEPHSMSAVLCVS
eukprot:3045023-Rhodomonas_salina.1